MTATDVDRANMWHRWFCAGAVAAMVAVGAGALGAHALKARLDPASLAAYETAVRYQMYHAFALLAAAWIMSLSRSRLATAAAVCFLAGMVLFSGSIYGLTLVGWKWLGPVTPLGGATLMVGWLLLALAAIRCPAAPRDGTRPPASA